MIPLINLHSLSISSQDTCLIPYLTAPVVRNLHIQFIDGPEEEPYPQKSAIIVLDFLDQGLPLETLTLGIELGDKYVAHSRIITLPDLQTLYISSKDPWALVHLQTPKIRNLCVRLSRIETDNREAQENYPNVLEFLERSSQLGFTFIRFDEWCSWDPPVVITLRPLFIPEKEDWIVDRLHRYYLAPDTRLPEDEVRDFIRRSGCTPVLSLHVDQFEEC
ncbi:hypothetical protein H0H92_004525 [Tricholoma furcatifolium]|nr:hypothetical protein H0H92_004525 [Tricholoma furcatifolium]